MKKKYEMDMCSGSVFQKMLLFAIPLMCSSILQLLFNAADIVVVGRFAGDNALAAVGSNSSLINLLTNVFVGLSIGTNVLTAQYYGAKKEKDLKETVHTSILLSVCSGVILTFVGIVGAKPLLELMQAPKEVLSLHMGVTGVAAATAISQTISAGLVVRCLIKEQGGIHLDLRALRINRKKFARIVRIGLPAGFQGMVFSLSNVVIQSAVNSFGAVAVAGNSAAANIEGFVYMAMNAFYQATISFTSQNYGAREHKRIYRILFAGELYVIITGVLLGNLAVFFGKPLLGIYSPSADVVAAGLGRLKVICTLYALCGMMDVLVGALRGIGYSVVPMVVSLIGACGLRLLWIATIFQIPQYHSMRVIYISYPVTWTVTFLVHALTFWIVSRKALRGLGTQV